jgi:hypothetical protein
MNLTTCAVYDDDDECRIKINTRFVALRGVCDLKNSKFMLFINASTLQ